MKIVKQTVYKVEVTPEDVRASLKRWQEKPETKAMMAENAAECKAWVDNLLAQIDAQKKR